MNISIAIDGPAGAGKSTLAKAMAKELGLIYVDTGAIYRTVGLAASRAGLELERVGGVIDMLPKIKIEIAYDTNGVQRMYLNGEDVSEAIRQPDISMYASAVSALPEVRAFLMDMQRNMAETNDVIMDGRDIGTVVLPDAPLKIFLTASAEERAKRRHLELLAKGNSSTYEEVLNDIIIRDRNDSCRSTAPLKQAEDAVLLDTSDIDFEGARTRLIRLIKERFSI